MCNGIVGPEVLHFVARMVADFRSPIAKRMLSACSASTACKRFSDGRLRWASKKAATALSTVPSGDFSASQGNATTLPDGLRAGLAGQGSLARASGRGQCRRVSAPSLPAQPSAAGLGGTKIE
jgi:hypothetical protein